jgi:putative membrane protein
MKLAMKRIAGLLIIVVALLHVGFMVLEMFFWDHPFGQRSFSMTPEFSAASKVLAANQGLYNGFLAAGLAWAFWSDRRDLKIFFLACVTVAGVFGGLTAKFSIIFVQALPAALALAAVMVSQLQEEKS